MALVHGKRTNVGFELESIRDTETLHGDEAVVEALLRNIINTYKDLDIPIVSLSGAPLEIKKAATLALIVLIHEICIIVPNEVNRDPAGGVVISRKLRANIQELNALGIVDGARAGVILARKEIKHEILLVSVNAAEAVVRYHESLTASRPAIQHVNPTPRVERISPVVIEPYRRNGWKHDLLECCTSPGTFCLVCCFPFIAHGLAWQSANDDNVCCCCCCSFAFLIPMFNCCLLSCLRGRVREQHKIEGDCCSDCCAAYLCTWCTLIQVSDEMNVCGCMERS